MPWIPQDEIDSLRARVAELEATCDRLKTEQRNLEHLFKTALARITKADAAIAAKDAALKPLADVEIADDDIDRIGHYFLGIGVPLTTRHVKAARAALSLPQTPPSPEPQPLPPPNAPISRATTPPSRLRTLQRPPHQSPKPRPRWLVPLPQSL